MDPATSFITNLPKNTLKMVQSLQEIFLGNENELTDSDNLLKSILDSAAEYAIVAADLQKNIITWNEGARKIFGYEKEEVIGKRKLSFLIPDEEKKSHSDKENIRKQIEKGIWKGESLRKRKNGETFYARIIVSPLKSRNKVVIGSIAIIRDVTNEKLLYREIEEAKILNENILNSIPSGIVVLKPEGNIVAANLAFLELTGNLNKPVKGRHLCELLSCSDAPNACDTSCFLPSSLKRLVSAQTKSLDLEREFTFKSGHKKVKRYFLIKLIRMKVSGEEALLVIFNDFTEKRILEQRIQEYMDNLRAKVDERTREIQKSNRMFMEELEVAKLMQKALLKNHINEIPNYKYLYKFYPSKLIGGDFFNIHRIRDDYYYFYISDVSGHGVPAAMLTTFFHQIIRAMIINTNSLSPAQILSQTNKAFFRENFPGSPFVTTFFCVLDIRTNRLTYSVAGHHNAIIFNKKEKTVRPFGYFSKPIGLVEDYAFKEEMIDIKVHDNIFLFTDGILEVQEKATAKSFGFSQLMDFIRAHVDKSESTIIKSLIEYLKKYQGNTQFNDDVAILDIKREI